MKKILILIMVCLLIFSCVACNANNKSQSTDSYVEADTTTSITNAQDDDQYIDVLCDSIGGSTYKYHTGSGTGEISIKFENDVTRANKTLKGHCVTKYSDGSGGDRVSYIYHDEILGINLLTDSEIVGLKEKDIHTKDFIVYKDYLIRKATKNEDVTINTTGTFDLLLNGYMKFNANGTMTIKEYKLGDTVVMPEGYYSGTYTREGNLVVVNSYCAETNHSSEWYLYIDDAGKLYTEVYANMSKKSSVISSPSNKNDSAEQYTNGKLIVGITPDYEPFGYFEDGELTGFDVDLIIQIAAELGYGVEFKWHSFDTLLLHVEKGDVDLAISAIEITEYRKTLVEFTDVYVQETYELDGKEVEASYAIALPKNSPLTDSLNKKIQAYKENGKIQELIRKYDIKE